MSGDRARGGKGLVGHGVEVEELVGVKDLEAEPGPLLKLCLTDKSEPLRVDILHE